MLPDAIADALAFVIAEKERDFARMLEGLEARHIAAVAELRTAYAEQRLRDRDELDELMSVIRSYQENISNAVATLTNGKDGPVGRDGETGPAGPVGDKGDAGEKGAQGDKGEAGAAGAPGPIGDPGAKGEAGRDGLPGVPGPPGRDGKDGTPGRDGAGFDLWDVEFDGERTVTFLCGAGDRVQRRSITLRIPIYRGVWRQGRYQNGDTVTQGGSLFVAVKDTDAAPESNGDWVLACKRGQNGKDGKPGATGPQGPQGRPGLDLTQVGPDGAKWR